jgi:hypothetical protein
MRQARLKAGARHERTLEAVACTRLFGMGDSAVPSTPARLPPWLMLPKKRNHGLGNRLGLLQQEEVPCLGNFYYPNFARKSGVSQL